ncbi:MAG: poly-gamma-glutamate synthase PgsB, partial [Candidatus Cloacimonadota bacterium]|nr:poly-gamma-glutamate synthase PgsB [Candidatus Cloacimonadota bacterium]
VEHKIVNSDIGVITNSRLDHLDVMGPGLRNVTLSLCNTIPKQGVLLTAEKNMLPILKQQAKIKNSELIKIATDDITDKEINNFNYIEHKDNVALALAVCKNEGIEKDKALQGMYKTKADIGAAEIFRVKIEDKPLYFAHSFAANDPESTFILIDIILSRYRDIRKIILVLNTREDRIFRSKQLIDTIEKIEFNKLLLVGQQVKTIEKYALKKGVDNQKILALGWVAGEKLENYMKNNVEAHSLIFGIGNIGGNGAEILEYFKARSV